MILEQQGQLGKALELFEKARQASPDDAMIAAMTRNTRKRADISQDQEEQNRIDALVDDLLKQMETGPRDAPTGGWTSRPLTIWIMDLETTGYSMLEGEDRLLTAAIQEKMLAAGRIPVVEHAILDSLLKEIKFGTSKLTDKNASLQLGRILSARLILSGKLIFSGPQKQISVRLIETETGRIVASAGKTFAAAVSASEIIPVILPEITAKIEEDFPLRAKIAAINGKEPELNIGSKTGVQMGQNFIIKGEGTVLEIISLWPEKSQASVIAEKGGDRGRDAGGGFEING